MVTDSDITSKGKSVPGMKKIANGMHRAKAVQTHVVLPGHLRLRPMHEPDLPAVYMLEKRCQLDPWPLWYFRRMLRKGASCWVLEHNGEVVGFGIVSMVRHWAHIMNMCVAPNYRRRGLGRRILIHLLATAKLRHANHAWLEVRPTNRPAILLYRKQGFRSKHIRKDYYRTRHGRQNAIVMARQL
jgi:ribosomal-protein-alanine N-acetyltransferase